MRILLGTTAHNQHVANIARALHECGLLEAFRTGGVDLPRTMLGRAARRLAAAAYPELDSRLARRRLDGVPRELVTTSWRWEIARLVAREAGASDRVVDWIWERSELSLDRRCARLMEEPRFAAFFGVEHGALSSVRAALTLEKPAAVAFLSAHHATRAEWVDPEIDRFPAVVTRATRQVMKVAPLRNARRDEEARLATVVHCASSFTAHSLIRSGLVTGDKLTVVPLGCPPVVPPIAGASSASGLLKFMWSGSVAMHKGIATLFDAWTRLRPGARAELHVYGTVSLPSEFMRLAPAGFVFHGHVNAATLQQAYQSSNALVFPTLCDGFGMVVPEAFAHGLPVITTTNAGAADLIVDGINGFVVPPRNADALAERLAWCLDHRDELEAMRARARETADVWSWADFRRELVIQLGERFNRRQLGEPAPTRALLFPQGAGTAPVNAS